jgi:RNA polymerase sigma-70 factor (ECF subfamily)
VTLTAVARRRYFQRLMSTGLIGVADADLARAIAAGADTAEAAETELYRRFAPRVRLYGLRHLRDEDAARDLVQQVLLLTIEKLRKGAVRDMDMIGSFVLGTCRMHAVNIKRRDRRREALLEAFPPGHPAVSAMPLIDEQELEGCLTTLSERERTVVLLTFYGDRSSRDIAQALGISEGNVRVIRSRAVDRLRACMRAAERPS